MIQLCRITLCLLIQAVLPLRGKILNVERRDEAAMYKNEEIQNLILGLGLGVKVISSYFVLLFGLSGMHICLFFYISGGGFQ